MWLRGRSKTCAQFLLIGVLSNLAICGEGGVRELYDRFYVTLTDSIPCFRLTNRDSQIGCSASDTNTRGVVHYVGNQSDVEWVLNGSPPHSPYIVLMEQAIFSTYNVPRLRDSGNVNGILLRYDNMTAPPDDVEYFSAERECPNKDFGVETCFNDMPWNIYTNGTSLIFTNFGDFPIFAVSNETFETVLECFSSYNRGGDGGIVDYPLCAAEMVADMLTVRDTATCIRRDKLLTVQLSGMALCDPLGDKTVWGSLFELNQDRLDKGAIMLATKLDSIAFFPYLSWGANNELASIATQLAVLQALGKFKQDGGTTEHPILFAFFHGESWDYIGSSKMVYDMERDRFPEEFTPKFSHDVIMDYLELANLGLFDPDYPVTYYHNITSSSLLETLLELSDTTTYNSTGVYMSDSSRPDLPVAALQRFLMRDELFPGAILSDFDANFTNRFYGSRYDNIALFSNDERNLTEVSIQLANLASLITQAVLMVAGTDNTTNYSADPDTIQEILQCFLVASNCPLFKSVLTKSQANELRGLPLSRYVTVESTTNSETIITRALAASFTGLRIDGSGNLTNESIPCKDCSKYSKDLKNDQVTVLQQYVDGSDDMCYCVVSYVHYHTAVSPAFEEKDYHSGNYSTWVESRWRFVNLRIYLVTYSLQEVAFLFCGLAMIFIALLVAVQGARKSDKIFNTNVTLHSPMRLTTADRMAPPEPIDLSDYNFDSELQASHIQ